MAEVEAGFLQSPLSASQRSAAFGHENCLDIRRFLITQGQKDSPMDDALRLRLRDVDVFAAMALELGRRSKAMGEKAETWVGRCVDVSKAYKQLGISVDHQDLAVIAPESGEMKYFQSNTLLFDISSAAFAFNRVSALFGFSSIG